MRIHVVSDVHGAVEPLARAGEGADLLFVLGDLLLFIDYTDPSNGIMADLFGADVVREFVELRTAGRHEQARALTRRLWASLGERTGEADPRAVIEQQVRAQYERIFAAMPTPALLTYGNVDVPALWPDYVRDGMRVLDGEVVEVAGRSVGFVGGGLPSPLRTPFEVPYEEYARKVAALGAVDVLCCHIPPAIPDLAYDVVARRFETGSDAVLDAIRDSRPELVLFGHVHQPLVSRTRIGRTECVNVGHFRATGRPHVMEW